LENLTFFGQFFKKTGNGSGFFSKFSRFSRYFSKKVLKNRPIFLKKSTGNGNSFKKCFKTLNFG